MHVEVVLSGERFLLNMRMQRVTCVGCNFPKWHLFELPQEWATDGPALCFGCLWPIMKKQYEHSDFIAAELLDAHTLLLSTVRVYDWLHAHFRVNRSKFFVFRYRYFLWRHRQPHILAELHQRADIHLLGVIPPITLD